VAAQGQAAGAGGYQELTVRISGDVGELVFDLAVPGQEVAMSRRLLLT
jgi:hypothetical protein